ncbi:integrase, catalytic region, zinc finger, CCHC-type containing protein [Tanacetum coccineum]
MNSSDPSPSCRPTKLEVPKELPKVSMVNTSLKKLKHHLAGFDVVVKERTTTTAITEGSWGPKRLSSNETGVNNIESRVQRHFELKMNKVLNENERLLEQVISKDIVNIIVNAFVDNASVNMHECEKCLKLETELLNKKDFIKKEIYDKLFRSYTTLEKHCISLEVDTQLNQEIFQRDNFVSSQRKRFGHYSSKNALENLKIDVEPIAPRLLNNRTTHSDYLRHTQEQAVILREIVKQGKSQNPLNNSLDFACKTANVQHSKLNANSELLCVKCNGCMLSDNHDLCVLDFINDVNAHAKSKSAKKSSKRKVWKLTGKVFTNIGYIWRPTSRTFTIVGNACPLTRITKTTEVPLRKSIALETDTPKPVVTLVYLRKPKKSKLMSSKLFSIAFRQHICFIRNLEGVDLLFGSRGNNLYTLSLGDMMASYPIYFWSKASKTKSWLWHRCLSHLNFGAINHLARHDLVQGLPKLKFEKDHLCSACAMGKSKKKPHKPKSEDNNQEKLYLLHMDLCGPIRVASVNGNKYILVIVDDYSRFTWVKCLRIDNGTKFVNQTLREYYEKVGISHETYVARSPQQNGVVERRNHTLIEATRTMLIYEKAPLFLWAEAVATACYTQNRSIIRLRHGKTPYELLHDKLPDLSFFHVFGALCYPTNDSENLGKLQPKADIGIFIGYAPTKKAFQIYNRRTRRIIKTIHVDFDELTTMASEHSSSGPDILFQPLFNELLNPPSNVDRPAPEVIALIAEVVAPEPDASTGSPSSTTVDQDAPSPSNSQTTPETQSHVISNNVEEDNHDLDVAHMNNDPFFEHVNKWTKDHPLDNIIGELRRPVSTRLQLHEQALFCYYDAFLTSVEPKNYKDALTQACWIEAMQEELNEFEHLEVWELVPRLDKVMVITLKWIYKVKLDELGGILKNKARVARGNRQVRGNDFEESCAPVSRHYVI